MYVIHPLEQHENIFIEKYCYTHNIDNIRGQVTPCTRYVSDIITQFSRPFQTLVYQHSTSIQVSLVTCYITQAKNKIVFCKWRVSLRLRRGVAIRSWSCSCVIVNYCVLTSVNDYLYWYNVNSVVLIVCNVSVSWTNINSNCCMLCVVVVLVHWNCN